MSRRAAGDDAAARIATLERELAVARAALEDFAYSVSHDLRAPLRHVTSYLKIIREDLGQAIAPEVVGYLDTASDAAALMGRQIDGLLQLSRLGRTELQVSDVDLNRLLADARAQLEPRCAGRHVQWQVEPGMPMVRGDMALIGQALTHLLANAIKFTAGRDPAQIRVGARRDADGRVAITVADNGVGFDPRFADRLFKVFQRLHASHQYEGLGLGLAFVRQVAERHGGSVAAQGAPDQGCQFTLTLPGEPVSPAA